MTTSPLPDPVEAPHWTIRPERPIDLDQIHELHRSAFRGADEAELVDAIRSGATFIPELSLVAVTDDGSILGHALVSQIQLVPDTEDEGGEHEGPVPVLALAPIAVLPEHQEQGIGAALMEAALAGADDRPEPMIAVLGAPAFYARFGFVPAAGHGLTGPYDDAGDAFQVRARPGADVPAGRLVYPSAFAGA